MSDAVFIPADNGLRCRLILAKDHCAVLVRIPVTARLSGSVTLEKPVWKNGKFFAVLNGSGTAMIAKNGEKNVRFEVKSGSLAIQLSFSCDVFADDERPLILFAQASAFSAIRLTDIKECSIIRYPNGDCSWMCGWRFPDDICRGKCEGIEL